MKRKEAEKEKMLEKEKDELRDSVRGGKEEDEKEETMKGKDRSRHVRID